MRSPLFVATVAGGLVAAALAWLPACATPDLGPVPFLCNQGSPACPDGYTCVGKYCVEDGTCPDTVPNVPGCGAASSCGNGVCDTGEDSTSCPQDCPAASCGDGTCVSPETHKSCPSDCPAVCGDGVCDGNETTTTCAKDCSSPVCGDGKCESPETKTTCPVDCGGTCSCTGKVCGDDGCGNSCGTCSGTQTCNASGQCEAASGCGSVANEGCCNGSTVVWCSSGQLKTKDCSLTLFTPLCGWSLSGSYYTCTLTGPADPLGQYPKSCP